MKQKFLVVYMYMNNGQNYANTEFSMDGAINADTLAEDIRNHLVASNLVPKGKGDICILNIINLTKLVW